MALLACAFAFFCLTGLDTQSTAADSTYDFSAIVREIVAAGRLPDLRWPDFSDRQIDVRKFYDSAGYAPAWLKQQCADP